MGKEKNSIFLDNKAVSSKEFSRIIVSIQKSSVLKQRGGFLFQSCLKETDLYIGIVPSFMEGERGHHYDIKLDYSDDYKFSGNFNADGTLGMVFIPKVEKENIGKEFKTKIKEAFITTLQIFAEHGLSTTMKLDWVTKRIIEEVQLFEPIPDTLGDILQL